MRRISLALLALASVAGAGEIPAGWAKLGLSKEQRTKLAQVHERYLEKLKVTAVEFKSLKDARRRLRSRRTKKTKSRS